MFKNENERDLSDIFRYTKSTIWPKISQIFTSGVKDKEPA